MKRLASLTVSVLMAVVLLCACTQKEETPTWQTTLPNTGVTLTISGGEVTESTTLLYPVVDGSMPPTEECLLTIPAVPTLTWEGVEQDDITVDFAYAWDNCYKEYHTSEPIEKVDYCPIETGDGVVQYRFDTSYSFMITVTTEQGTDRWILDCRRDI